MKTDLTDKDYTVSGELHGLAEYKMGVAQDALPYVLSTLSNMYSDVEMAVLREYAVNAWDAHVAAGRTNRPIEVNMARPLFPYLSIRDYGDGLSEEEVAYYYTMYGASSKRETNEQTGSIGIGCKSAIAYTAQFTVLSYQNGLKTTYSVGKDDEDAGVISVMDRSDTEEEDGLEVLIPAKKSDNFYSKAIQLFRYWEPRTVLVNSVEPPKLHPDVSPVATWMAEDVMLVPASMQPEHTLVMGKVPYPLDIDVPTKAEYKICAFVDIGSVKVAPSREALRYTKLTREVVLDIQEFVKEAASRRILSDLSGSISKASALTRLFGWMKSYKGLKFSDLTYNGYIIPDAIEAWPGEVIITAPINIDRRFQSSYGLEKVNAVPIGDAVKGVWVYGFPNLALTRPQRERAMEWVAARNTPGGAQLKVDKYYFTSAEPADFDWLPLNRRVHWEDIAKTPLARHSSYASTQRVGTYETWIAGKGQTYLFPAKDVDITKPMYYYCSTYKKDFTVTGLFTELEDGSYVFAVPTNRLNKFCRTFPDAQPIEKLARIVYYRLKRQLRFDDVEIRYLATLIGKCQKEFIAWVDPEELQDPVLAKLASLWRTEQKKIKAWRVNPSKNALIHKINTAAKLASLPLVELPYLRPFSDYPLWNGTQLDKDHLLMYLNAAYLFNEKEKIRKHGQHYKDIRKQGQLQAGGGG